MTKTSLEQKMHWTNWGGIIVTLVGVLLSIYRDPTVNLTGNAIALLGIAITCYGQCLEHKLSQQQTAAKGADDARIPELEERLLVAEDSINDPMHRMAVDDFASRYAVEHQDDGR